MCVTYCHKRAKLFWNHDTCPISLCQFAGLNRDKCVDCCYNIEGQCGLTRAALPATGGCCHWNVTPAQGAQPVTAETLTLLWPSDGTPITAVLDTLDTPYTVDAAGQLWVDPAELGLPEVYSQGTELAPVEPELPDLSVSQSFKFYW